MKINNSKNAYIMRPCTFTLLTELYGLLICRVCNKPIKVGQKVLNARRQRDSKSNVRHLVRHFSCAKKVGII